MIRWMIAAAMLIAMPVLLLWDRTPAPMARTAPSVRVRPAVAAVPRRRIFGGGLDDPSVPEVEAGAMQDVPVLVGVVGRLPDAAVAMIRDADGRSRPVAVGATTGDWRLEGVAADQAVFSRRGRRVRVRIVAEAEGG
ncbi:MAG TPA: hypothetical protein VF649_04910 [Sphingomonas sp.]|jgi:hypothetical protein|uniref:hypothetical protein n=1 Tax=Sphingomonas sp. TaxID=28214 RepID=UPI002ED94140